jgi:hypothetical protein
LAKSLIELRTDLKSLKYQGTNGSNPPYVTKDVNNPPSNSRLALEATARLDDVVRVGKALLPTNSRFIENQLKLNTLDTQTSISSLRRFDAGSVREVVQGALQRGKEVGKVALSTLAQTAVAGTGTRLGLGFRPTNSAAGLKGEVLPNTNSFKIEDRLEKADESTNLSPKTKLKPNEFTTALGEVRDQRVTNSLRGAEILGGSAPVYDSRAAEDRLENKSTAERKKVPERDSQKVAFDEVTGKQLGSIALTYKPKVGDYRLSRTGLGDQILPVPPKPENYTTSQVTAIDSINAAGVGEQLTNDLIKFYFKVITPDVDKFLTFRAYLTDFSDSYQGNWSDTQYIGRADKVLNYTGFSRDISLSFTIAASTRAEMRPLYNKIVYLASTTAPTYGGGDQNFMRGTLVELTVGDYLASTPGVITSVNYKWQQNYPWEIVLKEDEEDVQQLPMILDCSVSFKPIHTFIPQTGLYPYITDDTSSRKILDTAVPTILPESVRTSLNLSPINLNPF